jgi:hypothetical protein
MAEIPKVFFVDSGLVYDGDLATVITGLDHLENEEVYGIADGEPIGPLLVASGQVTIPTAAYKVMLGLPFKTTIKTLEPDIGAPNGSAYGQPKEVHKITAHFIETGKGVKMGTDSDNLRDTPDLDGKGLHTIDSSVSISDGYGTAQVTVEQENALPLFLSAISYDVSPGDE